MKSSRIVLLSAATLLGSLASSSASLVANYTFDNTINSAVGSFTGSNVNVGGTTYAAGKFGQAVVLTSGVDKINLGSATLGAIGTGDFSISMWVNWSGTISSDSAFFSNKNWDNGANTGINYAFTSGGTVSLNTYAGTRTDYTGTSITAGAWHNLVITRSGTSLAFYVDGTVRSTQTVTTGSFASANNFIIGDDGDTSGFYNETTGGQSWSSPLLMDDLAVYNSALTSGEITALQTNAATAVPEPGTYGLLGAASLAGVALVRRRRKTA